MDGHGNNKPSPLRNSKAVNQPFQSPLRSVLSPGGKGDLDDNRLRKSDVRFSPYSKNLTTPKKTTAATYSRPKLLAKRISQRSRSSSEQTREKDNERSIDEAGLKKIRDRISAKKKEIVKKKQLLCKKKHESKDLNNLIERWLRGCQEALTQFQKDISEHTGSAVSINEILSQLGIPPELVKYSIEDCDFT